MIEKKRSLPGSDFRLEPNIEEWGYKFHMNDINATIGLSNLQHVETNISKCIDNCNIYEQELSGLNNIELFKRNENSTISYWIYTIKIKNGLKPIFSPIYERQKHRLLVKFIKEMTKIHVYNTVKCIYHN